MTNSIVLPAVGQGEVLYLLVEAYVAVAAAQAGEDDGYVPVQPSVPTGVGELCSEHDHGL